jgi:serine/threonine protein kinase
MTDPHPLIGRTVAGRYTIRRLLGEGGMATVWVAEQEEEPHEVALKIMNEELTRDRTFVRRFEREAKAASLVVHPNSVKILSWGLDKAMPYIAMELVVGDDLYVLLEQVGPIGQARAARILAEVCDALEVAHNLGIVHRDLKPENIMVVPPPDAEAAAPSVSGAVGERVKVLDFGIAKLVAPDLVAQEKKVKRDSDPQSGLTQAGTLIGTPAYMSPEQCNLQNIDARSDLYTCGVLLYQLLTGRLPFEGEAPLHTAMLHIHEPLRKPSEFAPNIDAGLEAVVVRALEKKPESRFLTARELGDTLRALASTLPERSAIGEGKPSSRPTRAASIPATPKRFPATLRWMGDAPGKKEEAQPPLESRRTLVGEGDGKPASVRVKTTDGEGGNGRANGAEQPTSDDMADRAKTLIREPGEDSQVLQRPRSGPLGTEVIQLPPVVGLSIDPPKKREIKPTLRSADEFRPGADRPASVEIRVSEATPSSAVPPTADDVAARVMAMDADSRIQTLPMAVHRPGVFTDVTFQRTLPASASRSPQPVATMELTERPRFVEPFPISRARRAPAGLSQMSGARVLFLGFLAGAVLMAIVGVVYFYLLR